MLAAQRRFPQAVRVVEVGPRDGLQNESVRVPTEQKLHYISLLAAAGLPVIEATSFVSPRAIPHSCSLVASQVFPRMHRRRRGEAAFRLGGKMFYTVYSYDDHNYVLRLFRS